MCINNQQDCMNMQNAIANFAQGIGQQNNVENFHPQGQSSIQQQRQSGVQPQFNMQSNAYSTVQPGVQPNPQLNVQSNVQANPQTNVQPNVHVRVASVITKENIEEILNQLKPKNYEAPIKINEPSYLITEKQLKQLIGIAKGNPNANVLPSQNFNNVPNVLPSPSFNPNYNNIIGNSSNKNCNSNGFDTLANATFGTIGRIGHTFTDLASNIIDILTLGYASK